MTRHTQDLADKSPAARWDARYAAAGPEGPFGAAPNAYLRMCLARLEPLPRSALMLADGDGRNGSWLAARGLAVTAVDVSGEASRRGTARDCAAGAAAHRITADLSTWSPEAGQSWALTTLLYLQSQGGLRRHALGLAAGAVAPGGWLIVEGFAKAQAAGAMGPEDPDKLYSLDEVVAAAEAAGLELHEALSGRVLLDEGARHQGPAHVVRLLAHRRAPDTDPDPDPDPDRAATLTG